MQRRREAKAQRKTKSGVERHGFWGEEKNLTQRRREAKTQRKTKTLVRPLRLESNRIGRRGDGRKFGFGGRGRYRLRAYVKA